MQVAVLAIEACFDFARRLRMAKKAFLQAGGNGAAILFALGKAPT
jgi:hypothetical protein